MNALRLVLSLLTVLAAGCASYEGRGLVPGAATAEDVLRVMGPPALQWSDPDGARQLAYPRGPMGVHTFMVHVGPDGRLQRIENVLHESGFSLVKPGMTQAQVLRLLGPPQPNPVYFARRDELAWDWRYCDLWSQYARFSVLFDGMDGSVRSTLSLRESQTGHCGNGWDACWCSR